MAEDAMGMELEAKDDAGRMGPNDPVTLPNEPGAEPLLLVNPLLFEAGMGMA